MGQYGYLEELHIRDIMEVLNCLQEKFNVTVLSHQIEPDGIHCVLFWREDKK